MQMPPFMFRCVLVADLLLREGDVVVCKAADVLFSLYGSHRTHLFG